MTDATHNPLCDTWPRERFVRRAPRRNSMSGLLRVCVAGGILAFLACLCGCTTPTILHQTWPDGAKTDLYVGATFLSDKKLNNAAFVRLPNGGVVVTVGDYSNLVNVQATGSVVAAIGKAALAAIVGVP